MARGLISSWKQPFAYFILHSVVEKNTLKALVVIGIAVLKSIGLKIIAMVCDQGSNNRGMSTYIFFTIMKGSISFGTLPI